ncbi:pyridoxal phosphate-dependent aminotransferase [bacterium]|nr:pyridoxal phosphate-dependent aminotransferase [candidate division CSSED10-310 bacterium]
MKISYLSWYKDLLGQIYRDNTKYNLLSSGISEPWDLLNEDLPESRDPKFKTRMATANEWGHPLLIEQIASRYGVNPKNITLTCGASNGIILCALALSSRYMKVAVETPVYEPLWRVPQELGMEVSFFGRHITSGEIDLDQLAARITKDTQLAFISNLHNPTGSFISESQIISILEVIKGCNKDCYLVIDEIYKDFVPDDFLPAATLDDSIITISSLTKVYGLGFLRCGWIVASENLTNRLRHAQPLINGVGSRQLEVLTSFVFDSFEKYRKASRDKVSVNREYVKRQLAPLFKSDVVKGWVPDYGCVAFLRLSNWADSLPLVDYLAKEFSIFVVPGWFFREPSFFRIGFGIDLDHLKSSMQQLVVGLNDFDAQNSVKNQ